MRSSSDSIAACIGSRRLHCADVQRLGEYQNSSGAWYDLLSDGLSSTTVVVTSTGVVAAQLFAPYGQGRWAGGTMPTSYAFTGKRADTTTGLDYYGARYYDPVAGIFISADTASGKGAGLNRYGYVAGNPETLTDPTGHYRACSVGCGGGGGGSGGSGGDGGGGGGGSSSGIPGGGKGVCKYDPDGPECQGGGHGGGNGGGGKGPLAAGGSCDYLCAMMVTFFRDQRTQWVLYTMLGSEFGREVVQFLVNLAEDLQIHGEYPYNIIQWDFTGGGARSDYSTIHLNPSHSLVDLAGQVTHEAVEIYYKQADGINAATLPMDYVAEYFQGLVVQQLDPTVAVTALGQTYNEWLHDPHSPATGPNGRYPGEPNDAQLTGIDNENYLGNPMGLSAVMLSWEQNSGFANCMLGSSDSIIC